MTEAYLKKVSNQLSLEENDAPKLNCRRTKIWDISVRYFALTVRQEDHDWRSEL